MLNKIRFFETTSVKYTQYYTEIFLFSYTRVKGNGSRIVIGQVLWMRAYCRG